MRKAEIDDMLAALLDSHGNVSDVNVTVDRPLQVEGSASGRLPQVKASWTRRSAPASDGP